MKAIMLLILMNMFRGESNRPTTYEREIIEPAGKKEIATCLQKTVSEKVVKETNQMKFVIP